MAGRQAAALALMAIILAGCAGGAPLSDAPTQPAPAQAAEFTMAGRWILTAPNAPPCGLAFTLKPGGKDGTIVPEGGCPERFFTSRRWTLDNGALVIRDDSDNPLANLAYAADHFEGKSTTETPVTLTR